MESGKGEEQALKEKGSENLLHGRRARCEINFLAVSFFESYVLQGDGWFEFQKLASSVADRLGPSCTHASLVQKRDYF